jgi:KDO2-lipid IV(A) lauroyltransferase
LAKLYLRKKAPILPVILKRTAPGAYTISYFSEFIYQENNALSFEENVSHMTLKINQQVEDMIRCNPDEYFWMHNRWELCRGEL